MIKKHLRHYILFFIFLFIINMNFCYADNLVVTISGTGVALRSGPGTNYSKIATLGIGDVYTLVSGATHNSEKGCSSGWYNIYYGNNQTGYFCSEYGKTSFQADYVDKYDRPWTTPKKAIIGGAKFLANDYIAAGQDTPYLQKFNVNPNASHKVHNHEYMANIQAPYSQAYTSYKSYKENGLLDLPLEFTIPVFLEMPDYTILPGKDADRSCIEVTDWNFEALLDAERFPESYKCKLRIVHQNYPQWTFKALHTNLNFNSTVIAEKSNGSIQGGEIYYDQPIYQTEKGWYRANYETTAYYVDPRNFLNPERILMFEKMSYSSNFTEATIQSILKNTFMADYSFLDNQSYASIFIEAGKSANVSSVYLASLAKQESGTKGSVATSGNEFTYQGKTYVGLYNFFNIGAKSSAESPIHAGLVWASGGFDSTVINKPTTPNDEQAILNIISASKENDCLTGFNIGTTLSSLQNLLNGMTVTINGSANDDILKTGQVLSISNSSGTYTYTLAIKGDVDGDGSIGATDYVKIKNYIMEKSGSELSIAQSLAADMDGNGTIGATDYVKVKNSIMER